MKKNSVWKFTNGIELNEKEFCNYIEKKVFKTIRKYEMLRELKSNVVLLSNSLDLNTQVLNQILKTKFLTEESKKPSFSSKNLSDLSEEIFSEILKGNFKSIKKERKIPLKFHSDKEIQLYAKFKKIKGEMKKRDKRIQTLFEKFMKKNPDLEHNIVNAFEQLE
jgi:hypothetical protein